MERVRILLADDSEAVRKSLRLALETEPGFEVVGEATDGQQALELARRLRPHIVLMEPALSEAEGVEATRRIDQSCPGTAVIAYSVCSDDEDFARAMLEAGAAYLLTKGVASVEELVTAIRHAAETERGPEIRRRKLKRSRRREKTNGPSAK